MSDRTRQYLPSLENHNKKSAREILKISSVSHWFAVIGFGGKRYDFKINAALEKRHIANAIN